MENIRIFAFADEASPDMDAQITAMKRNGLDGLEIRNVDGTNVSKISVEKAKEVKKKLDAHGLVTWSVGSPIGKIKITDPFREHLEKFKHVLEIAHVLEAQNIRLFSFYVPAEDASLYKNEVMDRMGQMLELAQGSGAVLCHENEKGIYGDVPERCAEILNTFPQLKGIFDPANFVQCGVDTLKAWEMLKDRIYYMHIKDALTDGSVVPAGKGAGNVEAITKRFLEQGGRDFTIEPHLTVFDGLKSLEAQGEESKIGRYTYASADEASDAACAPFREVL